MAPSPTAGDTPLTPGHVRPAEGAPPSGRQTNAAPPHSGRQTSTGPAPGAPNGNPGAPRSAGPVQGAAGATSPAQGGLVPPQGSPPGKLVPRRSPAEGGPTGLPPARPGRPPAPGELAGRPPRQGELTPLSQRALRKSGPGQGGPGQSSPGQGSPGQGGPGQGGPFGQSLGSIQVQEPPKSKRALFATLGVLVLAGVATGGFFAVQSVNSSAPTGVAAPTSAPTSAPTAAPTAAPSVTTPAQPSGTSMLNSEITDPKALSLKEAFPDKKVDAAGTTFTRVKSELDDDCADAASGPFAEALKAQKCSRVLRATYVDRKRRYAVTTGIAVLPSRDAALEVDQAKNLDRNLWFRGLAGPDGSGGDRVNIAGGYAAGLVWGRYIVFSYATHADGHTPTGKEKTLVKVSSEFRDETAKVLERRVADN
ncbi:hypothetical protein OUY22_13670 [Nonomuraea sp. MCN248]|uniref:DUF3558 domain-containing protein n=1 Tax=Nonomuraea corallina TaxID=2989783 RepID=A0ABT4SB87_9ACTN|nr:hypothetical protein [Nonomuraea corallina]MDA0634468.1 hypothetical protein [Nonomuraea corallina]